MGVCLFYRLDIVKFFHSEIDCFHDQSDAGRYRSVISWNFLEILFHFWILLE
jgi:hypothetical protein